MGVWMRQVQVWMMVLAIGCSEHKLTGDVANAPAYLGRLLAPSQGSCEAAARG